MRHWRCSLKPTVGETTYPMPLKIIQLQEYTKDALYSCTKQCGKNYDIQRSYRNMQPSFTHTWGGDSFKTYKEHLQVF